jgi:hypothetical protein
MLGLGEGQMSQQDDRSVQINISGIPVAGVGGLGLVAMAVLVSVMMPAARWTMIAGLIGGVVLGVVLVIARRHIKTNGPSGTDPRILFRAMPPEGTAPTGRPEDYPTSKFPNLQISKFPDYSTR